MKKKLNHSIFAAVCLFASVALIGCGQGKKEESTAAASSMAAEKEDSKESMEKMEKEETDKGRMSEAMEESSQGEADAQMKNEGEIAPDFTVTDFDGNTYTLSEQKGKKVYVKFWASWCSACLSSLPELNELAAQENDFEIITVVTPGVGGEMDKEEFKEWFDGLGYENIRVFFDESGQTMTNYGVRALPTAAYIGTDGILVGTQIGVVPSKEIVRAFDELIK